jgi:hypothetical protein
LDFYTYLRISFNISLFFFFEINGKVLTFAFAYAIACV